MEAADLKRVASQVQQLTAGFATLADQNDLNELASIIHKPGFTSVAEAIFVTGIMDAMQAHTSALQALKKALLAGSRAVTS